MYYGIWNPRDKKNLWKERVNQQTHIRHLHLDGDTKAKIKYLSALEGIYINTYLHIHTLEENICIWVIISLQSVFLLEIVFKMLFLSPFLISKNVCVCVCVYIDMHIQHIHSTVVLTFKLWLQLEGNNHADKI